MKPMNQGDYVSHRARPDWGVGEVLTRSGDRLQVQFQHGLVTLDNKIAGQFLEKAPRPEGAVSRAKKPRAKKTAVK
jgi:hypothetical protein